MQSDTSESLCWSRQQYGQTAFSGTHPRLGGKNGVSHNSPSITQLFPRSLKDGISPSTDIQLYTIDIQLKAHRNTVVLVSGSKTLTRSRIERKIAELSIHLEKIRFIGTFYLTPVYGSPAGTCVVPSKVVAQEFFTVGFRLHTLINVCRGKRLLDKGGDGEESIAI